MSTHNLCFEQKYEKYQKFVSENFHFLVGKFSVYLNRHVFIMIFMQLLLNIFVRAANSLDPDQTAALALHLLHMAFIRKLWCTKF